MQVILEIIEVTLVVRFNESNYTFCKFGSSNRVAMAHTNLWMQAKCFFKNKSKGTKKFTNIIVL